MAASEQTDKPKGIEFYGVSDVYSESGIDLTLLRENLLRSIEERWEDAARGAAIFEAFQPAQQHSSGRKEKPMTFDPSSLVRRLVEQKVEFVVIGGMAMIAHGSTHLTKDCDICYHRTPANLAVLVAALAPLHPYLRGAPPDLPFRLDVQTLQMGLNFTLVTDYGALDLLGEVSGVGGYAQALAQSTEKTMFGMKVRVLSVDGLIAAKKAAARGKDQSHLLELLELKKMLDAAPPPQEDRGPA